MRYVANLSLKLLIYLGLLITWSSSATQGVTYSVYQSTASGGPYTMIATGISDVQYLDSTPVVGKTYYYVLTADLNGQSSVVSNEMSGVDPGPAQSSGQGSGMTSGTSLMPGASMQ